MEGIIDTSVIIILIFTSQSGTQHDASDVPQASVRINRLFSNTSKP